MIKTMLISGLLLCLAYAFLQRRKSRTVSVGISLISIAGIWFVLMPQHTTALADALGVGRGADLVAYFWIVISVFVMMNLQFKILGLQRDITEVSRELALRTPVRGEPGNGADPGHPQADPPALEPN